MTLAPSAARVDRRIAAGEPQWVYLHEGKALALYTEYVTHWRPLPAPPNTGEG